MDYLWLKAIHVACVLIWVSGLLLSAFMMELSKTWSQPFSASEHHVLATVRWWDRYVTSPSMLGLWGFGIWTAVQGQWFGSQWLQLKLIFVLVLSGLHGYFSGAMRRLASGRNPASASGLKYSPATILILVVLIAFLAVLKPF